VSDLPWRLGTLQRMSDQDLPRGRLHLLLPFSILGAAEDYGLTIAEGMARRGWEVTFAHSHHVDPLIDPGVLRKSPIDTDSPLAITRWLVAEKPGLLRVNQVFLPALGVARFKRIHPPVVTAHTRPCRHACRCAAGHFSPSHSMASIAGSCFSERNR
jgi:hypothetical protein